MMPEIEIVAGQGLSQLNTYLKKSAYDQHSVKTFDLAKPFGEGQVRSIQLFEGAIVFHFDVLLSSNTILAIDSEEGDMVHFLYCQTGKCSHQLNTITARTEIVEKQTAVVISRADVSSQIHIEKGEPLKLNIIRMDRQWYQKKSEAGVFKKLLRSSEEHLNGFQSGQFNFEIGDLVQKLGNSVATEKVSGLLHFKGLCNLILARQIEQWSLQESNGNKPQTNLLKRELQQIMDLTQFVENYPEVQHCVTSLCSKSSLSAAKLQQGFKYIHQQTVGEFIRNVRLKRSEVLLRTTEMNISEVVYSIGFTSRSYFCKIFKTKYGCSPKKYKNSLLTSTYQSA